MFNHFSTPGYPRGPHPTPSSNATNPLRISNPRLPRPPIQNPYDKFSGDDFDAWISNITGDIQRALGYEDSQSSSITSTEKESTELHGKVEDVYIEDDSIVEDSFAEVKARHALNKGKARDPREGPGLGSKSGDKDLPIEILSDEERGDDGAEEEEEAEEEEVYDEEEEEDGEDEWFENEQSATAQASVTNWERERRRGYSAVEDDDYEGDRKLGGQGDEEEAEGVVEEYEDEYEDEDGVNGAHRASPQEVVELLSDDEPLQTSHPTFVDKHQRLKPEEEDEYLSDEEPPSYVHSSPAQSNPDSQEEDELEDEEDEMQPLDDDTSFPPHSSRVPQIIDIPDPWAAVEKYAEDYYAGGDVRTNANGRLDPHHLGPDDDNRRSSPVVEEDERNEGVIDEREMESTGPPFTRRNILNHSYHEGSPYDSYATSQAVSDVRGRSALDYSEDQPSYSTSSTRTEPYNLPGPLHTTAQDASPEVIAIDSEDETEQVVPVEPESSVDHSVKDIVQEELAVKQEPEAATADKAGTNSDGGGIEAASPEHNQRDMGQATQQESKIISFVDHPVDTRVDERVTKGSPSAQSPVIQAVQYSETGEAFGNSRLYDGVEAPMDDPSKGQNEDVDNLVYWGFSHAFPPEIKTSASGHLDTPLMDHAKELTFEAPYPSSSLEAGKNDLEDATGLTESNDLEYLADTLGTIRQSTAGTSDAGIFEGYVSPAVIIANDADFDVKISIEEPEGHLNILFEEYAINIEAATPMVQSEQGSPEAEEALQTARPSSSIQPDRGRDSPTLEADVSKTAGNVCTLSPGSVPQVPSFAHQEAVPWSPGPENDGPTKSEISSVDINEGFDKASKSIQGMVGSIFTSGVAPSGEEAWRDADIEAIDITLTPAQDVTNHIGDGDISLDTGDEHVTYVIEELLTESEYRLSEFSDRDASLGVASIPFDEAIVGVVERGEVTETVSETGSETGLSFEEPQTSMGAQSEAPLANVKDAGSTKQIVDGPDTEVMQSAPADIHTTTAPSPESNDYFTQPGSPTMQPLPTDLGVSSNPPATPGSGLPSIINLPGTPHRVLSPVSTPAPGPLPVAIAIDPAVLKALKANPNFLGGSISPPARLSTPRQPPTRDAVSATITPVKAITMQQPAALGSPSAISPEGYPELGALPAKNGPMSSFPVMLTRKPTDPVLVADPYPYSLSTPIPPNAAQHGEEEGSEEDTEQDNSMSSSSSAEKDAEEKELDEREEDVHLGDTAELELRYPSELSVEHETRTTPAAAAVIDDFLAEGPESDTDADGEADPDFSVVDSSAGKSKETTHDSVADDVLHEKDPFKLMGNDSLVAPGEIDDPSPNEEKNESEAGGTKEMVTNLAPPGQPHTEESQTLQSESALLDLGDETTLMSEAEQPLLESQASLSKEVKAVELDSEAKDTAQLTRSPPAPSAKSPTIPVSAIGSTTPTPLLEPVEQTSTLSPESPKYPVDEACRPSPIGASTLPQVSTQIHPTHSTVKAEDTRRKVQVSVEDPYHADTDSDHENGSNSSRPGKRKRGLSDASNHAPSSPAKSKSSASKGKAKLTGPRSATKAARPRKEGSKKNTIRTSSLTAASRSPSVASTAFSDSPFLAMHSPTTDKPSVTGSESQPFLHAHSRRKRVNVPTTLQEQQLQKQLHKTPSLPHTHGRTLKAEDVLTKAPSISATSTSSPVTRSHCRYHKISIPKTEHGPRIFFLVPGCSLTDENLIVEEEIEDHGEAMIKGDTRLVDDIESLDFEPYLLWVMRQLVGRDIMQENEVFYLPEPDEEIIRKLPKPKKKKGPKPQQASGATTENVTDSTRESLTSHSHSTPSRASSVASFLSVLQQVLGSDDASLSPVTESEDEVATSPERHQDHKDGEVDDTKAVDPHEQNGSPTKGDDKEGPAPSRKRVRRLGQDAAAYRPSSSESLSDLSDLEASSHRKHPRNRGHKRSRGQETNVMEGAESRKTKKPKTQQSVSEEVPKAA